MQDIADSIQIRVFYEDTDAGGNVYHANFLNFCERARTEWLRKLGINQSTFLEQNAGFVVRKLEVEYLAPARLDDLLTITTTISSLKRASVSFIQTVYNTEQTTLCQIQVVVAYVNLQQAKPSAIPNNILGALKGVS